MTGIFEDQIKLEVKSCEYSINSQFRIFRAPKMMNFSATDCLIECNTINWIFNSQPTTIKLPSKIAFPSKNSAFVEKLYKLESFAHNTKYQNTHFTSWAYWAWSVYKYLQGQKLTCSTRVSQNFHAMNTRFFR